MSSTESKGSDSGVAPEGVDLFERLRELARRRPEPVATVSPERTASYRKLWSRVERATARLQGEWAIGAGQLVVYEGPAHPDALVLWLALCRLGARLLPFEHAQPGATATAGAISDAASEAPVLLVHLDGHAPTISLAGVPSRPLSSLIMRHCPHQPLVLHEDGRLDCIEFPSVEGDIGRGTVRLSLQALMAGYREPSVPLAATAHEIVLEDGVFNENVLAPVLLPALMAGRSVVFGAQIVPATHTAVAGLR